MKRLGRIEGVVLDVKAGVRDVALCTATCQQDSLTLYFRQEMSFFFVILPSQHNVRILISEFFLISQLKWVYRSGYGI